MGSLTAMGILFVKKLFSQKLSAKFHYFIWFILIARLVIPFSLPSPINMFNLIPHTQLENNFNNDSILNITKQGPQNIVINAETVEAESIFKGLGFNLRTAALIWFKVFIMILIYICFVNLMLKLKLRKLISCQRQDITSLLNLCKLELKIKSQ